MCTALHYVDIFYQNIKDVRPKPFVTNSALTLHAAYYWNTLHAWLNVLRVQQGLNKTVIGRPYLIQYVCSALMHKTFESIDWNDL